MVRPPRQAAPAQGLLGHFSVDQQRTIVSALKRDGFYVFSQKAPEDFLDSIEAFAREAPAVTEQNRERKLPLEKYDPDHPVSRTYKIPEQALINSPPLQELIADPVFVAISERYLNTLPAIGGLDTWWSARYGNEAGSDAAQLFHFDFDAPPAWLKLFVYVTDVTPEKGPHVYVRGSHKAGLAQTREFRSRGYQRISDEEMEQKFGTGNLVEITGQRGTVFMADTRGFHKGKFPTGGDRLLAQVIYCSPIFNDHATPPMLPVQPGPSLAAAVTLAPQVYERYRWRPE
jgi:hypothetical protein